MARICPRCHIAHDPVVSCETAKEQREVFQREVEHHKQHCPGCPNPSQHVMNLRREKEKPFPGPIFKH